MVVMVVSSVLVGAVGGGTGVPLVDGLRGKDGSEARQYGRQARSGGAEGFESSVQLLGSCGDLTHRGLHAGVFLGCDGYRAGG